MPSWNSVRIRKENPDVPDVFVDIAQRFGQRIVFPLKLLEKISFVDPLGNSKKCFFLSSLFTLILIAIVFFKN
jgi:hypothetical protein